MLNTSPAMRRYFPIILWYLLIILDGCIHQYRALELPQLCNEEILPDAIHIRAKMRLELQKEKVSLIENISIKNGKIRIDVLGVFDNTLISIIIKDNLINVIDYSNQIIYRFSSKESFAKQFNINLPVFNLPFLLTLSPKNISGLISENNNTYSLNNGEKITVIQDKGTCNTKQIYIDSPESGRTIATYSEFLKIDGHPFFHNLRIINEKQDIRANIKVLKVHFKEIADSIFDIEDIKGFNYVNR